jgi:hypothetical protein
LTRLVPHPDHANRMSRRNFAKLVRHIERTGCYEPLVVRPCPGRSGFFQIVHGHGRCDALRKLGHKTAEVVVWEVDDEQADLLLATLNRLNGRDTLDKKLTVLRRLSAAMPSGKLAKLLPQTQGQIDRLLSTKPPAPAARDKAPALAIPMVFFVDESQQRTIEAALSLGVPAPDTQARAARRAAALAQIAGRFLDRDGVDKSGQR